MAKKSMKDEPIGNDHENKSRVKLTVSQETKDQVMSCIPDFLEHHPEMDGMNITENMIVKQLVKLWKRSP